jgi:hypothetical protein
MAGESDGYGDFGGGGSVKWEVKVGDGQAATAPGQSSTHGKRHVSDGVDKYEKKAGELPGYFLVNIEPPRNGQIRIKTQGGRLLVYLPVNPTDGTPYKPQINVRWGSTVAAQDATTGGISLEALLSTIGGPDSNP